MSKKQRQYYKQPIFARFENSDNARIGRAAKMIREELVAIVKDVEKDLGTEGKPLEGETRQDLMLYIHSLREELETVADKCNEVEAKNEELEQENAENEIRHQMQTELIRLLQQLSLMQDGEKQELQSKINLLTVQLQEMEEKPRQPRKPRAIKTQAERIQELESQLEKLRAAQNRQDEEQGDLNLGTTDEEGGKDVGSIQSAPAGISDEAQPSDNPPAVDVIPELKQNESGSGNAEESAPNINNDSSSSEETSSTTESADMKDSQGTEPNQDVKPTYEELLAKVAEMQRRLEEADYKSQQDHHNSNTPSGKLPPWKTAKPGSPAKAAVTRSTDDDESDDEALFDFEDELKQEAEALHDSDKSPNKKSGGKRGKVPGSPGGGRTMPPYDKDKEKLCAPARCAGCPKRGTCCGLKNAQAGAETRWVHDIEITRVATRYKRLSCSCPEEDGKTITGDFPPGVNNWFQYGPCLKTLAVTLNTVGMVSYERIADIIRGAIHDKSFSGASVNKWVQETAKKVMPAVRYIKAGVFSGPYLNSDESGVKVKGVLHWVHTACNMMFTYMRVDKQRGDGAMKRIGVLTSYMGTIITDCLASYWDKGSRHGLCNAHLLRELFALVKHFCHDKEWAQEMMDLLNEMNEERDKLIEKGIKSFSEEKLKEYHQRYRAIVEKGMQVHPDSEAVKASRGRAKQSRGRNLLDRLDEHEENFLLFLEDFNVPFTNNDAERSLRLVIIKRAVVGGFDTYEGADDFAVIWSYIATARKRKLSAYEAIRAAVDDNAVDFLFDKEEQESLEEEAKNLKEINTQQFYADREQDKTEVLEARQESEDKKQKAKEAEEKAAKAEAKASRLKAEAKKQKTKEAAKRAQKATTTAAKARKTADQKAATARKADEKANDLLEVARWRANAAMYFLEVEGLNWDFETAMAS